MSELDNLIAWNDYQFYIEARVGSQLSDDLLCYFPGFLYGDISCKDHLDTRWFPGIGKVGLADLIMLQVIFEAFCPGFKVRCHQAIKFISGNLKVRWNDQKFNDLF